jgi:nitrate reductase gamma subunit
MKNAFLAIIAVIATPIIGVQFLGLDSLFGVVIPYLAFAAFIWCFIYRVITWAKAPVPFRIPTTCGQEKSLPWIKRNPIECPANGWEVTVRMFLEIATFRSLFRNTRAKMHTGPEISYHSSRWLWLFAIIFHYSFLVIIIRHMRLFANPVPGFVSGLGMADGFLHLGAPPLYLTDVFIALALLLLFARRVFLKAVRYISLPSDYFALFLIFSIAISGILMRYVFRVDVVAVKELAVGLATFSPTIPHSAIGTPFFVHFFMVCVLMVYFPFSKLMHMGGVFLSPTRNMANNNRAKRHINPWNDPNIKPHAYADYEDDFREAMVEAGLPVEKQLPQQTENTEESSAKE